MSPAVVDKDQKAEHIAAVALTLFSEKGYAATSVLDIAQAAGVGKSTIYDYFDSKVELFLAAIRAWMQSFEGFLTPFMQETQDPVKRLLAFAQLGREIVATISPATARFSIEIMSQALMRGGVLHDRGHIILELTAGMRKIVRDIILDGISQGVFRAEAARDVEKIAVNFMAFFDGILLHNVISNRAFDVQRQIEFHLETIVRSLMVKPISER